MKCNVFLIICKIRYSEFCGIPPNFHSFRFRLVIDSEVVALPAR
jgi:hypothetical protein